MSAGGGNVNTFWLTIKEMSLQYKENEMNTSKTNLAYLCVIWAFALLIGVAVGLNLPFVLLVIATVLYLLV